MEIAIITLLCIAILLFILSFFRKDRVKQVEEQVENLSIMYMKEFYQLKKKVRTLEEELLITSDSSPFSSSSSRPSHKRLEDEVLTYYEHGDHIEEIAQKTGLMTSEVERILQPSRQDETEGEPI